MLLLMFSCKGDDIVINTDFKESRIYNLAVPLISSFKFTLEDALAEIETDMFYADDDGLINFLMTSDVEVEWEDLSAIKDINLSRNYTMGDHIQDGNKFNLVEKMELDIQEDARFDYAEISKGILRLTIDVPAGYVGNITVKSPFFEPVISDVFYVDGRSAETFNFNFDTKDHKLTFKNDDDDNNSFIPVELESVFDEIHGDLTENLSIRYTYRNVKTYSVYGYFGQQVVDLNDQSHTIGNLREIMGDANFYLKDLSYALNIYNDIGVPFEISANNLKFYENKNKEDYKLLLVNGQSKVTTRVNAATYENELVPAYGRTEVVKENSNIIDASNPLPEKVVADIFARANPDGEIQGVQNFVLGENNTLKGEFEIHAPAWLKIPEFSRKDTIEFDFKELLENKRENAEIVEELNLYFDFYNTLPFNIDANIYAIDKSGEKVDDIFSGFQKILLSGEMENDRVTEAGHTTLIAELSQSQATKFYDKDVKKLVLETKTSTKDYETKYVKFFKNYGLEIKISGELKFKIPAEE